MKSYIQLICVACLMFYACSLYGQPSNIDMQEHIIGTWHSEFEKNGTFSSVEYSVFPDNTFESVMLITNRKSADSRSVLMRIIYAGNWSYQGNVLTENINYMSPRVMDLPKSSKSKCDINIDNNKMSCVEGKNNEVSNYTKKDTKPRKIDTLGKGLLEYQYGKINYSPPESSKWWVVQDSFDKENKKYFLMFKRLGIKGEEGKLIEPTIALLIENVGNDFDAVKYYASTMNRQRLDNLEMFDPSSFGSSFTNSMFIQGSYGNDVRHNIMLGFFVDGQIGVQVICDSTLGVYSDVENDFKDFLKSINIK